MFVGVESFDRETLLAAKKNQNHPERYAELVQLCRAHGIGAHFSNIIGFPNDTEAAVLEHLRILRALRPDVASFYILTPVPGRSSTTISDGRPDHRAQSRSLRRHLLQPGATRI